MRVSIDILDEGYLICADGTQYAMTTAQEAIRKVKTLLHHKTPKSKKQRFVPDYEPLVEIEKFGATVFKPIKGRKVLEYSETTDRRLCLKYSDTKVYTTWAEVERLCEEIPENTSNISGILKNRDYGPRRIAVMQFIRSARNGLKPADFSNMVDPDADYRPLLSQNTRPMDDGGKLPDGDLDYD